MPKITVKSKPSAATSTPPEGFRFNLLCGWFEEEYGHGWKRRLAEVAGVPESNVHSWIKAGRMPPWVHRVFELLAETRLLRRNERLIAKQVSDYQQVGQVIEDGDGFAVYRSEDGIGKLVARGIPDLQAAREIAALPRLKSMSATLSFLVSEIVDEDALTDEEKEIAAEVSDWDRPPALSIEKVDAEIEDLAEALEVLTREVVTATR